MKIIIALALIIVSSHSFCQSVKRALFLGNSYTYFYNMPNLTALIANSTGDTLITDLNAPGGYTFQEHSSNTISLNKIMAGNWDFVVLQEQSQLPSFPANQVETSVFPYARALDSMINHYNHCCETVFFMTWGRKNGDISNCIDWPPVCTYQGMDSLLNMRYMTMTLGNNALVSPVGQVWKYIRQHYPSIELYDADNSHPSAVGSYVAACCFYTVMFRKDPTNITYNYVVDTANATNIKSAVKTVIFDSLVKWQVGKFDLVTDFDFNASGLREVRFNNLSVNVSNYQWDFGDGTTSVETTPVHSFMSDGNYNVTLTAYNGCDAPGTITKQISISTIDSAQATGIGVYPNPTGNYLYIRLAFTDVKNISIINSIGQKLHPYFYAEGNNTKIDLSMLPTGIYFISISTDKEKIVKKIIRQ